MTRSQAGEMLLRDALLGDSAVVAHPPMPALLALRRRRHLRRLSRGAAVMAAMFGLCGAAWWSYRPKVDGPSIAPTWLVRSEHLTAVDVVHTELAADVVRTPTVLPDGLVVRTRPGLFSPLSDEALLALLAGQSPVLVGEPGERRLVLRAEIVPQ